MVNIYKILFFIILMLFICIFPLGKSFAYEDLENMVDSLNALSEGCILDDVVGNHNPRMIAIWAGDLTRTDWYLRYERSSYKYITLRDGLYYYYTLHGRFPRTIADLDGAGLLPITPLDPVTGLPYIYGTPPAIPEDYLSIGIQQSRDTWSVTTADPHSPDGVYNEYTYNVHDDLFSYDEERVKSSMDYFAEEYPNESAISGYNLALQLDSLLRDYIKRRNRMPADTEDLLDSLWVVREFWAASDTEIDMGVPGSFIFGIDRGYEIAFAKWFDYEGHLYYLAWSWSPWPDSGWDHVPSWEEYESRFARDTFGWGFKDLDGVQPSNFIPAMVLWHCVIVAE